MDAIILFVNSPF